MLTEEVCMPCWPCARERPVYVCSSSETPTLLSAETVSSFFCKKAIRKSGLIWRAELHATRGVCKSALFFSPTSNSQLLRNTEEYSLKIVHIIGGKKAKTELSVPVLLVVHRAPITPGTSQMCSQREVVHHAQLPPETSAMCFQREPRNRARGNNPLHLFIWCLKESLARNI
ncbi:uncharacterized protein [Labrus bergylta]|uniref:uncharacterized protein isoform X2 n=1 Tax=Labrus bergylta TaxID=56723 RepID=UPI003313772E